jgi:RNA polymerase sigma factor (sigma-70 family)
MEVSALKFSGGIGLHGRSPLLRLQSDDRLIALIRRGNAAAFEVLVGRYESRLLAFCRHLLGSREDAEDVLQEVFSAAYKAIVADDRPINARPWLYRIARNRSLNHLRRTPAVGVDSMDIYLVDNGASTADTVHEREEFRLLVGDIQGLPETQRTALVLREMDALSYEQIAEAMETTVPSVKSLLVRARVSLAEAAEARLLTCDDVRDELGEIAEGLRRKPSPPVRRHLTACPRCEAFRAQLKETNKALAAILPLGPMVLLRKLAAAHLTHHAGSGAVAKSGAGLAGSGAAGSGVAGSGVAGSGVAGSGVAGSGVAGGAAAGGTVLAGGSAGSFISAGVGAIATKAAAGLAAAALVTAGAVEVDHSGRHHIRHHLPVAAIAAAAPVAAVHEAPLQYSATGVLTANAAGANHRPASHRNHRTAGKPKQPLVKLAVEPVKPAPTTTTPAAALVTAPEAGRTQTQTVPTVLPPPAPPAPVPVTPAPPPVSTTPPTGPVATPTDTTTTPTDTVPTPPPTGTTPTDTTSTPSGVTPPADPTSTPTTPPPVGG